MKQVKVINTKTGEARYINEKTAHRTDLMERHNLVIADEIEKKEKLIDGTLPNESESDHAIRIGNYEPVKIQTDGQEETTQTSPAMLPLRKAKPVIEAMETVEAVDAAITEESDNQARKSVFALLTKQKDKLNES